MSRILPLLLLTAALGAEARDSGWKRPPRVDLIRLLDLEKDRVEGEWSIEDGTLVCAKKVPWARIQFPYTPPDEYDLILSVERTDGLEAINVGLVRGEQQFHVALDGFAFKGTLLSGLSRVDGKTADNNETTYTGPLFTNGTPSVVVCSVRKEGVTTTVDGKKIFEWKGDYKRLTNHPAMGVPNRKALYLNAYNCLYRFSRITLVTVSGTGKPLR